jgi:hypothetical protein
MAERDKASGMKSAYELALERLERQGIERPDAGRISAEARQRIDEIRRQATARLAELEILHRDRLRGQAMIDPTTLRDEKAGYLRDRSRIEEERDAAVAALRAGGEPGDQNGISSSSSPK